MARKVTIEKFKVWIADEANVVDVLERIAGGLTLQKTALAVKQPYTCLHEYFHSDPEREGRYLAARKAWVDLKKDEAFDIAENVAPDRDHVAKAKLQIEVIDNQAKAYHRDRWGDRVQVEKSVTVGVDPALLGSATELLRLASEKVVAGAELVGEGTPPPALPAARPPAE